MPDWRRRAREGLRQRALVGNAMRDLLPPHPSAFGRFGEGSWFVPPCRVTLPERVFVGCNVVVHEHASISVVREWSDIEPRLTIGDNTRIGAQATIACMGDIEIGPDVLTAARVFIGDTYHGYEDPAVPVIRQPNARPEKVTIERGAFLGIGAVVLPGVTVGENAYVAAGAVVTEDVGARTLVVGNPARAVRRWDGAVWTGPMTVSSDRP